MRKRNGKTVKNDESSYPKLRSAPTTHRIEVDSDSARLTMTIANIPSENPKTGVITAHSVVALLRKMSSPLRVGI